MAANGLPELVGNVLDDDGARVSVAVRKDRGGGATSDDCGADDDTRESEEGGEDWDLVGPI